MAIGIRVQSIVDLLGAPSFVHAFFSTVSANLEDRWGERFPTVLGPLYQGELPAADVARARSELRQIRAELAAHPPADVVWDIEDRSARPPWGDDIAEDITDLSNYFVTSDGKDLFAVLDEALGFAEEKGLAATLESVGVTVGDDEGGLRIVPGS